MSPDDFYWLCEAEKKSVRKICHPIGNNEAGLANCPVCLHICETFKTFSVRFLEMPCLLFYPIIKEATKNYLLKTPEILPLIIILPIIPHCTLLEKQN
jgi:hypothetical protein